MKRIIKTKHVSFRQIKNMTANLRDKFKRPANIQVVSFSSMSGKDGVWFWVSAKDFAGYIETWEGLRLKYFDLIRKRM